jgi:polysaccharide export outer membrane protein
MIKFLKKRWVVKKFLIISGVLFFLGCSNKNYVLFQGDNNLTISNQKIKVQKYNVHYEYKIQPGDVVSVVVMNHPELSTSSTNEIQGLKVYPDGSINLPLIGFVKIAGLTQREATDILTKKYKEYLKKPYVKVDVLSKKVFVLGEVNKPGPILLQKDYTSLINIIASSGGFTEEADRKCIKIISNEGNYTKVRIIDMTKISSIDANSIILKPNDIVYIQPHNLKPTDVKIGAMQPIVSFLNSILSTIVDLKIITK